MKRAARRIVAITTAILAFAAFASDGGAQSQGWTAVGAGSDDELYLRALQLIGTLPQTGWASRPLSNKVLDSARTVIGTAQPWATRFAPGSASYSQRVRWRGASVDAGWNSAFVWGGNDGARWQGRGLSSGMTTGLLLRWKPLTIRIEPTLVYAQNASFPVPPDRVRNNGSIHGSDAPNFNRSSGSLWG